MLFKFIHGDEFVRAYKNVSKRDCLPKPYDKEDVRFNSRAYDEYFKIKNEFLIYKFENFDEHIDEFTAKIEQFPVESDTLLENELLPKENLNHDTHIYELILKSLYFLALRDYFHVLKTNTTESEVTLHRQETVVLNVIIASYFKMFANIMKKQFSLNLIFFKYAIERNKENEYDYMIATCFCIRKMVRLYNKEIYFLQSIKA